MEVIRGQIWWVDFEEPTGSDPGYRRPVLIVQHNRYNASRLATVLVLPLTSNARWANARGNVLLPAGTSGLPQASVVNVTQLTCIDRRLLEEHQGQIPARYMMQIDEGLRAILDIECPPGTLQ